MTEPLARTGRQAARRHRLATGQPVDTLGLPGVTPGRRMTPAERDDVGPGGELRGRGNSLTCSPNHSRRDANASQATS